jgi:protein TonB
VDRENMKPIAVLLSVLLLAASFAQDSAPSVKSAVTCRGDDSDAPDCLTPPRAIYSPDPSYPEKERKAGRKGVVLLWLIVGRDGLPRDIRVLRSLGPEFDAAAIEAVKQWKFSPATKHGKPVSAQIDVQMNFHLN